MTRSEFIHNFRNQYFWLLNNNRVLLDKFFGKPKLWTFNKCKTEALKYKTITEWRKRQHGSYRKALLNGWLKKCTIHMKHNKKANGFWTFEKCKEEALKYKHKIDWMKNSGSSYGISHKNKWIKELSSHMVNPTKGKSKNNP